MATQKHLIGLLALTLGASASIGCKNKGGDGSRNPGGTAVQPADPSKASAEAKAAFAKVATRYESARARGPLTQSVCAELAKDFLGVYQTYKAQMAVAKFNAGAVWEECGDLDQAQKIYEELVAEVPKYDLSYNNLGVIFWNKKQESKALDYFMKAVKANPATRAPRNNLAAALRDKYADRVDQSDFDKAERELQNVLAVDSGNRLAYENLARLYYDRGHLKDKSYLLLARLVVGQAMLVLEKQKQESADLYNIRGLLYMQKHNLVDALKTFKKAVEIDKNHTDAHMNIAMIALQFRDYKTAEESINIALRDVRQKQNVEAYLGLGVALRGQRKYADAEAAFNKAMKVDSSDPRALYNLGILYHEHIGPATQQKSESGKFDPKPYERAKDYFAKFSAQPAANKSYAQFTDDAKMRVRNIDEMFTNIKEMQALEENMRKLEAEQKKAEEEEKARLRKMEEELRNQQAAGAAGEAAPAPATPPGAGAK